jgi:hypothetical protein
MVCIVLCMSKGAAWGRVYIVLCMSKGAGHGLYCVVDV